MSSYIAEFLQLYWVVCMKIAQLCWTVQNCVHIYRIWSEENCFFQPFRGYVDVSVMRVPSGTARLLVEARLDDGNMYLAFPRDRMLQAAHVVDKFVQNSLPFCFFAMSHLVPPLSTEWFVDRLGRLKSSSKLRERPCVLSRASHLNGLAHRSLDFLFFGRHSKHFSRRDPCAFFIQCFNRVVARWDAVSCFLREQHEYRCVGRKRSTSTGKVWTPSQNCWAQPFSSLTDAAPFGQRA